MVRALIGCLCCFVVLCTPAVAAESAGLHSAGLRATRLRTESLVNPLGVEAAVPRLSWVVESRARGAVQSGYRILVASDPEILAEGRGDLWDSGKVESNRTVFVDYAGRALGSRDRCWWKVMSWDGEGAPGPWSETASWEMGLLETGDWQAEWIDATAAAVEVEIVSAEYRTPDGAVRVDVRERVLGMLERGEAVVASNDAMGGDPKYGTPKELEIVYKRDGETVRVVTKEDGTAPVPPTSLPYLRKRFEVGEGVARARLYVTALGVYEAWLNGERVGDEHMAPGWTDYRERVQYQVFDVTDQLAEGANTIGAIVGPGWFSGRAGLFHARAFYGDSPALLAQLEIEYEDGSRAVFVSDGSWERHDGPILAADIMDGEEHDARLEVPGW
ncbi:MAG: alpha-L-rhamnosidase N-terminal domain-containing protein, partial [Phycisphaerales bacterium]|nr:alpha-L-rhamnosidase N-terminal domain-containing protein [Phycisphaerales bacterium]